MRNTTLLLMLGVLLGPPALSADETVVQIRDFAYNPAELTVNVGTTVQWVNREKRQYHNVWFEALGEAEPDYLFPGDRYERTFATAGSFPYRCGPHPEMKGVIHVVE